MPRGCETKCEQRKGNGETGWVYTHPFSHMEKRSGEANHRERGSSRMRGPWCHGVPFGGEAVGFFQTPLLSYLPNAASGHGQDLTLLG